MVSTEQAPSESVALAEAYLEWVKPLIKDPGMQKMEAMARAAIAADRALVASQAQPAAEPRQDSVHAVESSSPPAAALGNITGSKS